MRRSGLTDQHAPLQMALVKAALSVKPAAEYFAEDYVRDFTRHGHESLCGGPLRDMMRKWKSGRFPRFPEYALCQFALNLHNQAFHAFFPRSHGPWLAYSAPFGDTRRCFSGHGLAGHRPDAIMRFVQSPSDESPGVVRYTEAEIADYVGFFLGDYLRKFADRKSNEEFALRAYLAAIAADRECSVSLLTPDGYNEWNVTEYLRG